MEFNSFEIALQSGFSVEFVELGHVLDGRAFDRWTSLAECPSSRGGTCCGPIALGKFDSRDTLGMMQSWWQGTRQQKGKVSLTVSRSPELLKVDAAALNAKQLAECGRILAGMKDQAFLPANEAYRDNARKDLDAALFEMLGLPEELLEALDVVRLKWCCELSVHGGKRTRPTSA